MSKEEVEKAINGLTAQYGNTAEFSVDQGKVVLDQENKRLEAENEALRKSVEELREQRDYIMSMYTDLCRSIPKEALALFGHGEEIINFDIRSLLHRASTFEELQG